MDPAICECVWLMVVVMGGWLGGWMGSICVGVGAGECVWVSGGGGQEGCDYCDNLHYGYF